MPYAFLEGETPVEIHAGAPFTTSEIVVSDDDGEFYAPKPEGHDQEADVVEPLAAGTVVQVRTTHPSNALELYGPDDLARYRIQHFAEPPVPPGKAVKTRSLVVQNGAISVDVTFEDAPPPEVLPLINIKVALLGLGKLNAVESAMASAADHLRIRWQSATEVRRDSVFASVIAEDAALSVDVLFVAAAAAEV